MPATVPRAPNSYSHALTPPPEASDVEVDHQTGSMALRALGSSLNSLRSNMSSTTVTPRDMNGSEPDEGVVRYNLRENSSARNAHDQRQPARLLRRR